MNKIQSNIFVLRMKALKELILYGPVLFGDP